MRLGKCESGRAPDQSSEVTSCLTFLRETNVLVSRSKSAITQTDPQTVFSEENLPIVSLDVVKCPLFGPGSIFSIL